MISTRKPTSTPSTIDSFFRTQYLRMCNYCVGMGFNRWDIEEEISDVVLRHYLEYKEKGLDDKTTARWVCRRAMLNLRAHYTMHRRYSWDTGITPAIEKGFVSLDDPQEIVSALQRLPAIPEILINYAAHGGNESAKGQNSSADTTKFCRARKVFLKQLAG